MADDPHNITNDLIQSLRGDIAKIAATQSDHTKRFSQIERQLAGLRGDMAVFQETLVDHGDKFLTIEERIARLERHAGLTETMQQ